MPIVGAFSVDGGKHSSRQNRPLPSRPNTEKFSASRQPRKTLAVLNRKEYLHLPSAFFAGMGWDKLLVLVLELVLVLVLVLEMAYSDFF